jgi:hypothetical protein
VSSIERIQTKQGHPVPKTALGTQGPFPRELYMSQPVNNNYVGVTGNGGPEVPFGSTAQNNFQPLSWLRCSECRTVFKSTDADAHMCDEEMSAFYAQQGAYSEDDDDDDEDDYDDDTSTGRYY